MWAEIIGWMLRFCLDGELLRASASGFLERASMPFLREVAVVCGGSLADTIVNPARVWFSLVRDGVNEEGEGGGGRMILYLEVLLRDSPVQLSCFEVW